LIEDAMSAEQAGQLAGSCLHLHDQVRGQPNLEVRGAYETLFGLLNHDQAPVACVIHPDVLAVVHAFLGPEAQMEECCSKISPIIRSGGILGVTRITNVSRSPCMRGYRRNCKIWCVRATSNSAGYPPSCRR
jgi:hypothetical protein